MAYPSLEVIYPQGIPYSPRVKAALDKLDENIKNISDYQLIGLDLDEAKKEIELLKPIAAKLNQYRFLLIVGMGGAINNPRSALNFLEHKTAKEIFYLDSTDPVNFEQLISQKIDLKDTAVIAISKSGNTLETNTLSLELIRNMQEMGIGNLGDRFVFITSEAESELKSIAESINATILNHCPLGGRFAAFSNITYLPLLAAGLDAFSFYESGIALFKERNKYLENSLNFLAHALDNNHFLYVHCSYLKNLNGYLEWNDQIISESLGKDGFNLTPIATIGPQNQHIQLQLYLDGKHDKFFSIYGLKCWNKPQTNNANLTSIISAQFNSLYELLNSQGIKSRMICIEDYNSSSIAELMMLSMLETIALGLAYSIPAFGQPAVEAMKVLVNKRLAN